MKFFFDKMIRATMQHTFAQHLHLNPARPTTFFSPPETFLPHNKDKKHLLKHHCNTYYDLCVPTYL